MSGGWVGGGRTCNTDVGSGNKEEEFGQTDRQTGWCKSIVLLGQTFVWPTIDWGHLREISSTLAALHATYQRPPLVTRDGF